MEVSSAGMEEFMASPAKLGKKKPAERSARSTGIEKTSSRYEA